VLELVPTRAGVVAGMAAPTAVDAAMATTGAFRVAPDELMVVGAAQESAAVTIALRDTLVAGDPDAVAIDTSEGWSVWSLRGDEARRMFGYLGTFALPEAGLAQGDVAHVPVRVVVASPILIHLLVPAMWGAYLRERLLERGRAVQIRAVADSEEWPA